VAQRGLAVGYGGWAGGRLGAVLGVLVAFGWALAVASPASAGGFPDRASGPLASSVRTGSVSAGGLHSCAVETDGAPICWGSDGSGQSTPPSCVTVSSISAGYLHSCAV
jgi:hypothetical protein